MSIFSYNEDIEFLRAAPPPDLHYIVGANCYQHARGFKTPILMLDPPNLHPSKNPAVIEGRYLSLEPPAVWGRDYQIDELDYADRATKGCIKDEGIFLGNDFKVKKGFRTVAMFTKPGGLQVGPDFHFAWFNEDWEDKLLGYGVRTHRTVKDVADSRGYNFRHYFLFPEDSPPYYIKTLADRLQEFTIPKGKPNQKLLILDTNPHMVDYLTFENITFFPEYDDASIKSPPKIMIPMPTLPPEIIARHRQLAAAMTSDELRF